MQFMKLRVTTRILNFCHYQHPALQEARGLYKKLGLRHPHARTKQELQKHEYLKTGLMSLVSLRKHHSHKSDEIASTPHMSTVHAMSSSEK